MIFIHILIISGIVYAVFRMTPSVGMLRTHLLLSAGLKLAAGLLLGYFYFEIKGGGDTIGFYEEAGQLAAWAGEDWSGYLRFIFLDSELPFESVFDDSPRARYISKWASICMLTGASTYWIVSIYFSLFAWLGLWTLALTLRQQYKDSWAAIALSLLYFPSVVFWTSGLTKESLAIGSLCFFLGSIFRLGKHKVSLKSIPRVMWALVMFYILWQVKYYYAGVLLLCLLAGFISGGRSFRIQSWTRAAVLIIAVAFSWLVIYWLHPNFDATALPALVYDQYLVFVEKSLPGRYVAFDTLCASWGCIIMIFPVAIASAFFLPLPFDAWSSWVFLAGFENVLLIVLSLTFLISLKDSRRKLTGWYLAAWAYCFVLAGFLAMSAPNLGTLVRYRTGFLPVLILLITVNNVYFYRGKKFIKQLISNLKR